MESDSLRTLIQQELVSKRGVLLSQCMDRLRDLPDLANLPGFNEWQEFLKQSRDKLVSELQTPDLQPLDSADTAGSKESSGLGALRDHGRNFANATVAWPHICEAGSRFKG